MSSAPAASLPPGRPAFAQVSAWGLVTALALVLAMRHLPKFQLGAHSDDAHYVVLAQSLVTGGPYARVYEPGVPGPATYPFGLPLLLAPLLWLFPHNFEILKLVPFASTVLSLSLIFWGWPALGRGASRWWAVGFAAVVGLQPLTIRYSGLVMSEAPFLAACLVSLWLVERVAQGRGGRAWPIYLGLALASAVAIRTVGVALPVAAALYLLHRRGRAVLPGLALTLLAGACAVALVVLLTPLRPSNLWPANYLAHQAGLVSGEARHTSQAEPYLSLLFRMGLRHLHTDLRNLFIPFGSGAGGEAFTARLGLPWLLRAVGYALSGCTLLGLVLAVRRWGLSAFLTFALVYFALMQAVLWTSHRLLYPIQFQLAFGLLLGLDGLARLAVRGGRRLGGLAGMRVPAVVAGAAVFAALGVWQSWDLPDSRLGAGDLEARTGWLEQVADPASVLLSDLPHVDYLYSGLRAAQLGTYAAPAELESDLERWQAGYVVIGSSLLAGPQGGPIDALVALGRLDLLHTDSVGRVSIFAVRR